MINPDIIGTIAAFFTTICFIPQAWKVAKLRETRAISLVMYILFSIGVFLWMIYGIMLGRTPIIIANIITLALSLTILFFKFKEDKADL